ncbi:phospholipase D-like domain-containing protein [Shewanella sp. 10N.286.45.A1]|uniref:phospholipase D-like domain-containing protein n=1 Tax=Shewanella sp. 10N.286.45.A1 TaxID=3229694 RepID=UPI00354B327C
MNFNDLFQASGTRISTNGINVYFSDIEIPIVQLLEKHTIVVGCALNLRNEAIIKSLSQKKIKSCIVLDKIEIHKSKKFYEKLNSAFLPWDVFIDELPEPFYTIDLTPPHHKNTESIRVFGVKATQYTTGQNPALHHKFLVFCDINIDGEVAPKTVVTGSFNFSKNATFSRENIVVIEDEYTAETFYDEWARCFLFSESISNYNVSNITPEFIKTKGFHELVKLNIEENDNLETEAEKHQNMRDFYNGAHEKF